MPLIDPPVGAIDRYLWDKAQDSIVDILKAVSTDQAALNPDYAFIVDKDKYLPTIEDITLNNHYVNIYVATVVSDEFENNFSKNHIVTYNIDLYIKGENTDDPDNPGSLIPPDEAAVAKLKYLAAMVEYGLTKLANFYMSNADLVNKIMPGKIDLTLNPVVDVNEGAFPYAPARFQFVNKFPYEAQDLENLPALTDSLVDLANWASEFSYS